MALGEKGGPQPCVCMGAPVCEHTHVCVGAASARPRDESIADISSTIPVICQEG